MKAMLLVGLGGAIGAMMRYAISLLPVKTTFPFLTFITNLLGAVLIGLIVGYYSAHHHQNDDMLLFLKTGVCGGFTTFSTFSLEALQLLEKHHYAAGSIYVICSAVFCIAGVALGQYAAHSIRV